MPTAHGSGPISESRRRCAARGLARPSPRRLSDGPRPLRTAPPQPARAHASPPHQPSGSTPKGSGGPASGDFRRPWCCLSHNLTNTGSAVKGASRDGVRGEGYSDKGPTEDGFNNPAHTARQSSRQLADRSRRGCPCMAPPTCEHRRASCLLPPVAMPKHDRAV